MTDARVREVFDLSRWFAGIGSAEPAQIARDASPESNARVREAIESLPITLFEFDRDGVYTAAAGRYVRLFGIVPAQVIGRSVFDFPRFVPGKNIMVRRALAGEAVSFTGIWPLGRFTIRLQPCFGPDGRVKSVIGIGFELAKRAEADREIDQLLEALRQSEARFRAMCESAPLGIYVSNPRLELGYVNPALCRLLGREPAELLGQHWRGALGNPESVLETGRANRPDASDEVLRLTRPDRTSVWTSHRVAEMRDGGEVVGYVGAITDITRERAARLATERAQQDLRRVIESSPEGIAIVRDGRWVFVNRAMAEALGYPQSEDLLGRDAVEIAHPDDRPTARALSAPSEARHGGARAQELRYRKRDGEYALMELTTALLTEFEAAPAVLITARDITERKRLAAQLHVTERLLSVGTLAAGVAHEINNPLAALLSNLEWISTRLAELNRGLLQPEDGPATAELRDGLRQLDRPLGEARDAAGRVREIVRDIKLFSRAEEDRSERVELTGLLDSVVRMAWNEVRHRARFVRDYGELPAVRGSDARLGQVFLNLIINAAQSIQEGRADENEIRISARALASKQTTVEVCDTGCGIPPSIRSRIFDPFFTTKPAGVGTGLGLAICHRIVTSFGGQIDVESQPGRGSIFRVTLASAEAATEPLAPQPAPAVAARSEVRGHVLVIDDDPMMGSAIELLLAEEHDVDVFTSARAALDRLHAGERYHAIVCDVMMPEMSGIEFYAELTRFRPELAARVVFMTGGAFTVRAREFLDRVQNPRLDKPFESHELLAVVNRQVSPALGRA